jgi:hypothetical protein
MRPLLLWILLGVALLTSVFMTVLALLPLIVSAIVVACVLIASIQWHGPWFVMAWAAGSLAAILIWDRALDWYEAKRGS